MARALDYTATRPEPDQAREELDRLIENLHQQGVFRLLNDALTAAPQVSEILLEGLNQKETRNAVQNVALLAMALGSIPPERFALLTRGATAALKEMQEQGQESRHNKAPGFIGFYRLLHDQQLWQGLQPALRGVEAFSDYLQQRPEKPAAEREQQAGDKGSHDHDA